jgi:hypothetical protein
MIKFNLINTYYNRSRFKDYPYFKGEKNENTNNSYEKYEYFAKS